MRKALLVTAALAWSAELRIQLRDGGGAPVTARLEVHGPGGKMYQPKEGAIPSRPPGRSGTSPYLDSFVTRGGSVTVEAPAGRYRIVAERGLEWERGTREVDLTEPRVEVELTMRPWIRMRERGWWSGDMHVHRPMEDVPALLEAEDLNFGVVFTMWNRQNLWPGALPSDWIRQTGPVRWMTVTNAEDERGGGAWMLHGLREPLGLEKVLSGSERPTESWDPPGIEFVRRARQQKQTGARFPWFDLEKPIWWEAPVMMALERPDSMGLLHNHYDQYAMYDNEAWGRKRDTTRFPGSAGFSDYSLHLMYRYWNLGWMVPPTAGAASGVLPNPVGYNRVYAKLAGEFTVEKWYGAVREGPVILSNGPLVFFEPKLARGRMRGRLEVVSRDEIERVELVCDGVVIRQWKPAGRRFETKVDIDARRFGWVAARAYAKNDATVRLGHTGPVKAGGEARTRREDARYFREWVEELARNPKTPPGSTAAALYAEAIRVYRELEK
ncbi:MAG: hypothetical protein U0Q16_09740 [Bryobacteraceae bacterium]